MPRKLAVVPPGAKAAPPKAAPKSVHAAAEHSERALLIALRTNVAKQIDAGVPSHALAALVRQLRELDHDIRALDARAEEEADDGAVPQDEAFDASSV